MELVTFGNLFNCSFSCTNRDVTQSRVKQRVSDRHTDRWTKEGEKPMRDKSRTSVVYSLQKKLITSTSLCLHYKTPVSQESPDTNVTNLTVWLQTV